MMVRGLYVHDMPLFGGKSLIIITTYFPSSIVMQLVMRLYGIPPCTAHILFFTTCIYLSISGTCSLAAVVFWYVPIINFPKQLN